MFHFYWYYILTWIQTILSDRVVKSWYVSIMQRIYLTFYIFDYRKGRYFEIRTFQSQGANGKYSNNWWHRCPIHIISSVCFYGYLKRGYNWLDWWVSFRPRHGQSDHRHIRLRKKWCSQWRASNSGRRVNRPAIWWEERLCWLWAFTESGHAKTLNRWMLGSPWCHTRSWNRYRRHGNLWIHADLLPRWYVLVVYQRRNSQPQSKLGPRRLAACCRGLRRRGNTALS